MKDSMQQSVVQLAGLEPERRNSNSELRNPKSEALTTRPPGRFQQTLFLD